MVAIGSPHGLQFFLDAGTSFGQKLHDAVTEDAQHNGVDRQAEGAVDTIQTLPHGRQRYEIAVGHRGDGDDDEIDGVAVGPALGHPEGGCEDHAEDEGEESHHGPLCPQRLAISETRATTAGKEKVERFHPRFQEDQLNVDLGRVQDHDGVSWHQKDKQETNVDSSPCRGWKVVPQSCSGEVIIHKEKRLKIVEIEVRARIDSLIDKSTDANHARDKYRGQKPGVGKVCKDPSNNGHFIGSSSDLTLSLVSLFFFFHFFFPFFSFFSFLFLFNFLLFLVFRHQAQK